MIFYTVIVAFVLATVLEGVTMFDLLLVLAFFISGTFAGVLSSVILSRRRPILRGSFSKKRAVIIGGIGIGSVGGIGMVIFTSMLTIALGEIPTITPLIVAFIEGFVPITVGVLSGFTVTETKLAN